MPTPTPTPTPTPEPSPTPTPQDLEQEQEQDQERLRARARRIVHRYLKARPRSAHEVRQRLRREGLDAQIIEETLAWARSMGLVDDAAFARLWVMDRLARQPKGATALRRELRRLGVAEEHIHAALQGAALDEAALIRALIRARLPRYRGRPPKERSRKLIAFLRRRGFSPEAIKEALRESSGDPIVTSTWEIEQ